MPGSVRSTTASKSTVTSSRSVFGVLTGSPSQRFEQRRIRPLIGNESQVHRYPRRDRCDGRALESSKKLALERQQRLVTGILRLGHAAWRVEAGLGPVTSLGGDTDRHPPSQTWENGIGVEQPETLHGGRRMLGGSILFESTAELL